VVSTAASEVADWYTNIPMQADVGGALPWEMLGSKEEGGPYARIASLSEDGIPRLFQEEKELGDR